MILLSYYTGMLAFGLLQLNAVVINIIFISFFFTIYRKDGGWLLLEGSGLDDSNKGLEHMFFDEWSLEQPYYGCYD